MQLFCIKVLEAECDGCLQAVEQEPVRERDTSSDRTTLELALQDIGIIKAVVSETTPVEALRTAKHLNEAYQKYLQMVRVWNKSTRRPWANAAETEVRGCNTAACDVSSSLYTL